MKNSKLYKKLVSHFPIAQALAKDEKGIAAIEFAFVAPIMIAMYFGMTEIAMGITADRNVAHATSVTGDLATQVASVTAADMSDIMTAALAVLNTKPTDLADVTVEVNSFQMLSDGTVNTVGYAIMQGANTGAPATFNPAGLNAQMLNAQSGVVVTRILSKYEPTTLFFLKEMTLSETFIMKPRRSISVPFDDAGKNNFTCTAASDLLVSCTGS